ncbi:hypothetical protein KBC54_04610, partial [Patescibacteria group bacterium]|nr:hypothetical protein [Patescibacteria group bacterium]
MSTGFAQTALAGEQMMAGGFGPYPCSAIAAGSGILNECHYSEYLKSFYEAAQKTWQFTIITGILNAFQYFNQKLATDAADFLLSGGTGKGTAFETKTFGKYLGDVAIGSANQFLSSINKFAGEEWGFNLCRPITLNLKLSLGIMKGPALPVADCTFDQVVGNFKNVYRSMQPGELTKNFRQMLQPGGNDIALTISANQKFMEKLTQANQSAILQRNENKGLKSVTDFISGRIKTPSAVALETFSTLNLMKIKKEGRQFTSGQMIGLATTAGLQQLPLIAASAFVNELATGALDKFFKFMGQAAEDSPELADLSNPDAQSSSQADGGFKAVGLTDILTPNLVSSDKQDFTFELSSCPSPRGPWGCSMDDAMMNGLHSAEKDGGNTIARAAGIGVAKQNSGAIFLHKDWELIPEWETKDSQDTGCYQRAYCATNLAKLRFARIIPIGWELAANSPFNKKNNGKYVTLETVVQNFSNCNDKGAADADHPWCHLINPGWVLTAPAFICQIRGFGDTLLAPNTSVRTQECTDVVSCLSSNDKGECTGGYGYCLSEKTAWRFGADSCEEKFVSCRTYQPRDKSVPLSDQNPSGGSASKSISYIRNTIDYGACSADNVGCLYYYTLRDVSTPAQDRWFMGEKTNPGDIWSSTYVTANGADSSPRVYFDGTVKKCDAANDGCTKMLAVTQNASALNLVRNSSFEEVDQKDPKKLVGWTGDYEFNAAMAENGDLVQDGTRGAIFTEKLQGAKGQVSSFMNIGGLRNYVVSFYVRKGAAAQAPVTSALVKFFKPAIDPKTKIEEMNGRNYAETATTKLGKPLIYAISPNCDKGAAAGTVSVTPAASSITGDWQRFTCEFVSPQDATAAKLTITGSNVVIDAVELEEGVAPTTYIAGVNEVLKTDYLKIAPDELRCDDTSTTTRTECGKYARMCKQTEVGCQGFTDVEGGNGIEIPATLNPRDLCPHTCVGYAEYRKLPSAFDLTKDNAPLNDPADQMVTAFIPKSAKQCSAAVAGCEEFTNIQSQATGGEQKVYLTYARACEKPGLNSATYFTWEGSDTAGYQLRTWSLMKKVENQDVDKLYPYPGTLTAPRIILKAGPSGLVKDPATCTQETWKTGFDPDCRQFYDEKGAAFYRYFSQTVLSTPSCTDYRKNDSDIADCSKTGGVFDSKTNECVYHIEVAQSSMCTSEEASCRGYIGTTGRNTATMISESFASASSTAFYDPYKATDLKISNEALMVGDHSLLLTMKVKDQPFATAGVDFQVSTSSLYTVSFWAKSPLAGAGGKIVQLSQFYKVNEKVELGTVALSADWKRYEIGPFVMGNRFATGTVAFASSADQTYIDTVSIQRLQDIVYVRKDSWTSFAQCDQTLEGIPQPQAMLGCRSYTDRKGRVVDVREFSRLCRYETIGCSAYVNTRNSQDPYGKTFA